MWRFPEFSRTPSPPLLCAARAIKPPAHPEDGNGVSSRNVGKLHILMWLSAWENFIDYLNICMRYKCKLQEVTSSHDLFKKCYITKETSATFSWRHQLHSVRWERWFQFGSCFWPDHVQAAVAMQWFGTVLLKRNNCIEEMRMGLYALFSRLSAFLEMDFAYGIFKPLRLSLQIIRTFKYFLKSIRNVS